MVKMSNWPPLVAMSVVTRWRRTFSSSVTHFTVMPGFLAVKSLVSPCIRIMSPLLTVAIVSVVCASAGPEASNAIAAIAAEARDFILTSNLPSPLDLGAYARRTNVVNERFAMDRDLHGDESARYLLSIVRHTPEPGVGGFLRFHPSANELHQVVEEDDCERHRGHQPQHRAEEVVHEAYRGQGECVVEWGRQDQHQPEQGNRRDRPRVEPGQRATDPANA